MQSQRDADRSRRAILDAAERLFAHDGFERTTLEQVARAAGLSRGTPRYFFGSKEQLYQAVLTRLFTSLEELGRMAAAAAAPGNFEELVANATRRFLAFLAERPAFVLLLERESLAGSELLATFPAQVHGLGFAVDAVAEQLPGAERSEAALAVLSLIALCLFPVAHPHLVRALGMDPTSEAFREALAEHVPRLLTRGLRPPDAAPRER